MKPLKLVGLTVLFLPTLVAGVLFLVLLSAMVALQDEYSVEEVLSKITYGVPR